jgi:hypothetical protein
VGGAYQLNVTVPASGVPAGNDYLDISGPDSYNSEAIVPVGSGAAGAVQTSTLSVRRQPIPAGRGVPRRRP